MPKSILLSVQLLCFPLLASGQAIISYNVENLFDTINDRNYHDEAFLPNGKYEFNAVRYWLKIRQTARALRLSIQASPTPPQIIALMEVENQGVLFDLARSPALRDLGPWHPILFDSPDYRGIDCAALIHSNTRILNAEPIRYATDYFKTRDALFIRFRTPDSTTAQIIAVHLPSKRGGPKTSEIKRKIALEAITHTLDSVTTPTLLCGDFNTSPKPELRKYLNERGFELVPFRSTPLGTYKFKGRWSMLDWGVIKNGRAFAEILEIPELMKDDLKWGGTKPKRSWSGTFFTYGYSDHLPVYYLMSGY